MGNAIYDLYPVYALILIECIAFALLVPMLPIITTEYFAKILNHGERIDCVIFARSDICREASSKASFYSSLATSAGSLGMFFVSATIGHSSDKYGRKPFLVFSQVLHLIFPISIVLFDELHGTIALYYIISFLTNVYSTFSISMASVADKTNEKNRTFAFSVLMAIASAGFIISAALSSFLKNSQVLHWVMVLYVIRLLWAVFVLVETLEVEKRVLISRSGNPILALRILFRSVLFRRLTALVSVQSFVVNGISSILFFYLNNHFGFDKHDIALYIVIEGTSSFFVQGVLVKPLTDLLHERGVVIVAVFCSVINYLILAFAVGTHSRNGIFLYAAMAGASMLAFPAISSLKSINCTEKEQGQVQGAIYSARALAGAFGPIVFATMYHICQDMESSIGKAIPFLTAAGCCIIATLIAISLPKTQTTPNIHLEPLLHS